MFYKGIVCSCFVCYVRTLILVHKAQMLKKYNLEEF